MESDFNTNENRKLIFVDYIKKNSEMQEQERAIFRAFMLAHKCSETEADSAYRIIQDRFGSLRTAIECEYMGYFSSGSVKVDNIMHLLPPIIRRVLSTDLISGKRRFTDIDDCMAHIINTLRHEVSEVFYVLYLSERLDLYNHIRLSNISPDHVDVDIRSLLMHCPALEGCEIIVAHNHRVYSPAPSAYDIQFTEKLSDICDQVGIKLIDHIITHRDTGLCLLSGKRYSLCSASKSLR